MHQRLSTTDVFDIRETMRVSGISHLSPRKDITDFVARYALYADLSPRMIRRVVMRQHADPKWMREHSSIISAEDIDILNPFKQEPKNV